MTEFFIRNLDELFGAEVTGLQPEVPLGAAILAQLRKAFDERGLLIFRGMACDLRFQDYLSQALIGNEDGARAAAAGEQPVEYYVSNKENGGGAPFGRLMYHCDMMWSDNAFQLLGLHGTKVEQPAVPTLFVSAVHGWKTLPPDLRARVEHLYAEHGHDAAVKRRAGEDRDVLVSTFSSQERVLQPVGKRHPRTGETMLYVCPQMTCGFSGMAEDESEELLNELFDHLYAEKNVVAHHWREGDLVLWDNLALQHARPNVELAGPVRTLRKSYAPRPKMNRAAAPQFAKAGS